MNTAPRASILQSAVRCQPASLRLNLSLSGALLLQPPMSSPVSAAHEAPGPVVIIDPDPAARAAMQTALRPLGVEVLSFDSAESYLLSGSARSLACLIVDLLLPGMSGLELLRRLRSSGSNVPVILLAEEADVATAVAAMREGATDFIEKPYVEAAVLKQVQKLLHTQDGDATFT
jgi:two-component system, chemotaxis family, CheB/CheR fusion protein